MKTTTTTRESVSEAAAREAQGHADRAQDVALDGDHRTAYDYLRSAASAYRAALVAARHEARQEVARVRQEEIEEARAAQEYEGWSNRETWAVVLHLDNDQTMHREALAIAGERGNAYAAGEVIGEYVRSMLDAITYPGPADPPVPDTWRHLAADVGSAWRVDWHRVGAHFLEKYQEQAGA